MNVSGRLYCDYGDADRAVAHEQARAAPQEGRWIDAMSCARWPELSCEELVTALIERTRKADPDLNSYITSLPEQALAQAPTAGVRTTAGAKSMLGVDRKFSGFAQPAVLSRFEAALKVFEGAGASIREVSTPTWAEWLAVSNSFRPEFVVSFREVARQHPADLRPQDVPFFVAGALVPAVDYIRASQQRCVLQRRFAVATSAVLRAAHLYEQATAWQTRRPPSLPD